MGCTTITDVVFSGDLGSTLALSIISSTSESGGWGQVRKDGWHDYGGYPDSRKVSIMPPDIHTDLINPKVYSGDLSLKCDGETKTINLPDFKDIGGDGFIGDDETYFNYRLYVGDDGSTYYDEELTVLAKTG